MKLVAKRVGRTIGKPTVLSELPNSDHTESVPSVRPPSLVAQIGGLPGDWWHENQAPMRAASSFRVGRVRSVMCVAAGPASGPASGLGSVALSQGPGSMVALAPSTGPRASGWPGVPAAPQQKSCNSPWLPRGRPPGEAEGPADSGELKMPLVASRGPFRPRAAAQAPKMARSRFKVPFLPGKAHAGRAQTARTPSPSYSSPLVLPAVTRDCSLSATEDGPTVTMGGQCPDTQ